MSEVIWRALDIYHDGSVNIRPDYLFPAFTAIEHLGDPPLAKCTLLYH
jgi:hypothetical protein